MKMQRNGMALFAAIAFLVIIATLGALSLRLITQTTKTTVDAYLYEQSAIYAKSAAELALLEIAKNGACTTDFSAVQTAIDPLPSPVYIVTITPRYIYKGLTCGGGNDYLSTPITTDEQNGSVVLDISVEVNSTSVTTEPIRYFRRTIQKL